jgi:hypothetical protein
VLSVPTVGTWRGRAGKPIRSFANIAHLAYGHDARTTAANMHLVIVNFYL